MEINTGVQKTLGFILVAIGVMMFGIGFYSGFSFGVIIGIIVSFVFGGMALMYGYHDPSKEDKQ